MFLLLTCLPVKAQYNISFRHITTVNGLSDNNVSGATIDKKGFLWIATNEGLNRYDGRSIVQFYKDKYPALKNNNIRETVCDNNNRLWIRTFGGFISMIDEQQQWHSVEIKDNDKPTPIFNIINTKSKGVVLFKGAKQFIAINNDTIYRRWRFADDSVFEQRLFYSSYLSPDEVIWTGTNECFIMNYAKAKVTMRLKVPFITSAAAFSSTEIYITTSENGGFYVYNLQTGKLTPLHFLKDQYNENIFSSLQMVGKTADDRLVITSLFAGIYLYDPASSKLLRYTHDPLNKRSVATNNYHNLICDSSGHVFVASLSSGLSYFNIHHKPASWVSAVTNGKGKVFDGYVNALVNADTNNYWIGGYNELFKWNKTSGKATFYDYGLTAEGKPASGNDEVLSLCKTTDDRLLAGTASNGIVILNNQGHFIKQITVASTSKGLPGNSINYMLADGKMAWISTDSGICILNAENYKVSQPTAQSPLFAVQGMACSRLWKDAAGRLWIATWRNGAYCYNPATNVLFNIGKRTDGGSMEVFAFEQDSKGNIYAGTMAGLMVITNDTVVNIYNSNNGLRSDRCENVLKDGHGNIWIENHSALIKFKPASKTFEYFDEKAGLSDVRIRAASSYTDPEGNFYFGNENGFSFFHPDSIAQPQTVLRLTVSSVENEGKLIQAVQGRKVELSPGSSDIAFNIAAVDLEQSQNLLFRYQLVGHDKQLITEKNISVVRYSGLPPGKYEFQLQFSGDGLRWTKAAFPVLLEIKPAYWQTWWFRFGAAFLLATLLFITLKQRERLIHSRAQEKARLEEMRSQALQYQLEIEQVINYFATSLSGLQTVDDVLWDVVKTCISQLGFQDCVIYLYNPERTVLLQKAAYGPKNIDYTDIYNRVEIEPGSGIVGHVAVAGKAEIINDTSKDSRYIVDDAMRLSEIAVPLTAGSGVIGVIDSEHPDAGFYNNRHLQILTAIGNMVVNKIEQLEAEANIRNKEIEMARLQRDVATLQLTATRAQMNPHFIFNALNSVQQYILQGHTEEANRYLSRFSRLQRDILNHCDKPFITLQKEMEMLRIYLELEQLRFDGNFDFELIMDNAIDAEELKIPPMILQPFVENAIWHGLMPKQGHRQVEVAFQFNETTDELSCIITDNGIGRKASEKNKVVSPQTADYVSKGLSLVYRRLELLQEQMGRSFTTKITDLLDKNGNAAGTSVEVIMFTGY